MLCRRVGRVTLTADEAAAINRHVEQVNEEIRKAPKAMQERFRIAMTWRARE